MAMERTVTFTLGGIVFEYDENKNRLNIKKHGISFRNAARVFFDYDRIEMFDDENSGGEERYDTIGRIASSDVLGDVEAGLIQPGAYYAAMGDILFVVYTERIRRMDSGKPVDVIRLISARMATSFERGLYYGKLE